MLNGGPLDWGLQEAVAKIREEDWEKGAAHVAEKIQEIEARFDLKRELENAEKEIARSHAQRLGIGGNNPPEAIDDLPEMAQELTVVWGPFRELEKEVDAEVPNIERVKSAISKLMGLLAACGKWVGEKVDAAASEYAKAIGKWGGTATTVWIAAQTQQIEAVLKAAQSWLLTLLP